MPIPIKKYIPNRNNKITNFKIGDTVIYNPNCNNLDEPHKRIHDIGKIVKIDYINNYIYFVNENIKSRILVEAIDHYPPKEIIIITI
jgi:hypothetical protein